LRPLNFYKKFPGARAVVFLQKNLTVQAFYVTMSGRMEEHRSFFYAQFSIAGREKGRLTKN